MHSPACLLGGWHWASWAGAEKPAASRLREQRTGCGPEDFLLGQLPGTRWGLGLGLVALGNLGGVQLVSQARQKTSHKLVWGCTH